MFTARSSREISELNDLIASSCTGFGMTFAIKIPVSVLKINRLYLLVLDRSSLSLEDCTGDTDMKLRY